jgi:peptide/nickel transport system permease protein
MSFLGLGAQPPQAEWGVMLSNGRQFLRVAPWVSLVPGTMIFLVVLTLNLLGDRLRDLLDPRMVGR